MQMKIFHPLRGGRPDGGDPRAADLAGVVVELEKNLEERLDPICACENDPVVSVRVLHQFRERAQIARRLDSNCWQLQDVRTKGAQLTA